jgi:shikimate dehydrogenase
LLALSGGGSVRRPRERLGVLGWPVAHSRSPAIQNAALLAAGCGDWRYQLLPVAPELFGEVVPALAGAGFRGANVTIPHKSAALALATRPTARATAIGAANTLVFEPGEEIVADNTDAPGLIDAIAIDLEGASALVLGAGGTARAAVWALNDAGARVTVWNRTLERARELCTELGGTPVTTVGPADLLVNCTSVGLDGSDTLEGLPLAEADLASFAAIVDFVYTDGATALVRAAQRVGVPTVDGLDLLVAQGALSFERFTGRRAPIEAMRAAVGRGRSAAPRPGG